MERQFTVKQKPFENFEYLQYMLTDKDETITFNNAEYVRFNAACDAFRKTTEYTDWFFASMTSCRIKKIEQEKNRKIASILLVCIPQETNRFLFCVKYLDPDDNVMDSITDDNYFNYRHFKEKLKDTVSEQGVIYDLLKHPKLKNDEHIKHLCPHPSTDFGITVNGKPAAYTDTFRYDKLDILNASVKKNMEKIGADHILFRFDWDHRRSIHIKGSLFDKDNQPILTYQAYSGIKDADEYDRANPEENGCRNDSPFEIEIPIEIFRLIAPETKITETTK